AMRALIFFPMRSRVAGQGTSDAIRWNFLHPTGLWNTQPAWVFMPFSELQEGELKCEWKFFKKLVVAGDAPRHEGARKRQQVKFAGEIGLARGSREIAESAKREQILDTVKRLSLAQGEFFGPEWPGILAPVGARQIVVHG